MSQDTRLYGVAQVWDQALQVGQLNLVQAIRDFWPTGIASVLDVGCGDGKLTSRLVAPDAPKIVGLDSSAEALSRLPFEGVLGDAQALPFPDAAFDLVMSTDTLEHMPDVEETAAWGELFRVAGKVVMVAVPFREELLDATARCVDCGQNYHVNWHQRRYDIADLHRRAPAGWQVRTTVLAGEPWSAMLPPETQLRRTVLGEWSGWELAICPHCGSGGRAAMVEQPLPSLLAQALAKQLYPVLAEQRYCRSHSEILVIFQRDDLEISLPSPLLVDTTSQPASIVDFNQPPVTDLRPFCQVAQRVASADGRWRLQFPLFEAAPTLYVSRQPGSQGALQLMLEDSVGSLFEGCVLEDGQAHSVHQLPRAPVAGYYGVLASCTSTEPFASVQLGRAPEVLWAVGDPHICRYLQLSDGLQPMFAQVSQTLWFDPATLNYADTTVVPTPAHVLAGLQACFDSALQGGNAPSEIHAGELNALRVQIQNLTAERDALLQRATAVDQLTVQLQNLSAERDALQQRATQADQFAVQVQNLSAERDALQLRALDADCLLVQLQNLGAEREALLQRATTADQLAVQLQNLSAERDALQQRATQADQFAVQVQNLSAERDALQLRALDADCLLVQLQNLSAERDALLQRAREADQLAVLVQNLSAERDVLLERAIEADRLAVHVQNLGAERDAFVQRAATADHLAVQLQNLDAEHIALSQQAQTYIETLQQQDQHFHQHSSEAQAQHQEVLGHLAELKVHNQNLNDQLHTSQAQLVQLNQHMENRMGIAVRNTLASLVNKK